MGVFGISEAARELGCSESWLRHSEARGRIPKARRDMNNWRVYTVEDIEALKSLRLPGESQAGNS